MAEPLPPRRHERSRIIWFGDHGKHGRSGMTSLADICPALLRLSQRLPIELLVVSNHPDKFRDLVQRFPIQSHYVDWHPTGIFDCIRSSDVFVMPNSRDQFSEPKSAGRAVLALSLGVPVVATMIPSMEPLRDAVFTGDWETAVYAALTDREMRRRRLALGRNIVCRSYGGSVVAGAWDSLLREVT